MDWRLEEEAGPGGFPLCECSRNLRMGKKSGTVTLIPEIFVLLLQRNRLQQLKIKILWSFCIDFVGMEQLHSNLYKHYFHVNLHGNRLVQGR